MHRIHIVEAGIVKENNGILYIYIYYYGTYFYVVDDSNFRFNGPLTRNMEILLRNVITTRPSTGNRMVNTVELSSVQPITVASSTPLKLLAVQRYPAGIFSSMG